jgi:hypothetical protein
LDDVGQPFVERDGDVAAQLAGPAQEEFHVPSLDS